MNLSRVTVMETESRSDDAEAAPPSSSWLVFCVAFTASWASPAHTWVFPLQTQLPPSYAGLLLHPHATNTLSFSKTPSRSDLFSIKKTKKNSCVRAGWSFCSHASRFFSQFQTELSKNSAAVARVTVFIGRSTADGGSDGQCGAGSNVSGRTFCK